MRIFHWFGRVVAGAGRLAVSTFLWSVALFSRSLEFVLGVISRLYGRFDAGWANLGREARERHAREGRRIIDPINLQ